MSKNKAKWDFSIKEVPEIVSKRLILNEIKISDIEEYNSLVLDEERNSWWGYDDVGALGGPVKRESFFDVAKEDFIKGDAINFAVREKNDKAQKMIGEAVLYDFDYEGKAELGCRIKTSLAGKGYGVEAFGAVIDWAIKSEFLDCIVAKCFKENIASYKMLSKTMESNGQDDTYHYFIKKR